MALTTKIQKGVQCLKCKDFNCVPVPDKYGFSSCIYCGGTQDRRESPPEPTDYKVLSCGHMFAEECECDDDEDKDWDLNII